MNANDGFLASSTGTGTLYATFNNCDADNMDNKGFETDCDNLTKQDMVFNNCTASNCGNDGYSISSTAIVTMVLNNCIATLCADDGFTGHQTGNITIVNGGAYFENQNGCNVIGGAICRVYGVLFYDNTVSGGDFTTGSGATFINCTFDNNVRGIRSAEVPITISKSVFTNHSTGAILTTVAGSPVYLGGYYNMFHNNTVDFNATDDDYSATDLQNTDPQYINASSDTYSLMWGSPCINAVPGVQDSYDSVGFWNRRSMFPF